MIKKFTIVISLIILTGCGFSPMHSKKNNNNFSIEQVNFTGDSTLNNFLKINLKRLKNQKSNKNYYIETKTEYKRNVLTKDNTGKITSYELTAKAIFIIDSINKKLMYSEKKVMDVIDDKFEENKYEIIVKQNFATSISNKLVSDLVILQ